MKRRKFEVTGRSFEFSCKKQKADASRYVFFAYYVDMASEWECPCVMTPNSSPKIK